MIELTDNPFSIDADCRQVSCHFDQEQFDTDIPGRFDVSLPPRLQSAVRKRKAEFIAGRYCAQQALGQLRVPTSIVIDIGEDRSPIWPNGKVGSITHTHGYASAMVAERDKVRSLGIDSEQLIAERTADNVKSQILTETENYETCKDLFISPRHYLTFVFSAKESLFKCLHPLVNKFFGFHAATITPLSPPAKPEQSGQFRFELLEDLNAEFSQGFSGDGTYSINGDFVHTAVLLRS